MIIRSRRKNDSILSRLLRRSHTNQKSDDAVTYSAEAFLLELAKETARSNRRQERREFSLVSIITDIPIADWPCFDEFVVDIRNRLRIYDVIGWIDSQLSLLLPETNRDGAYHVANEIIKLAASRDLVIETEIRVYPWDDELVSTSQALNAALDRRDEKVAHDVEGSDSAEQIEESDPVITSLAIGLEENSLKRFSAIEQRANMIGFSESIPTPWWKRMVDIVGAGTGLILLSPVFLAAGIVIKLNSRGPVFFKQMREGLNGEHFEMLKFRTMRIDAESLKLDLLPQSEQDGPAFKIKDDPRVTSVGKYLRRSCVDELPQLINVLRGEMSLVGPRPLPVNESIACEPWQRQRLRVVPGLTGVWQVDGGRDTKFVDWMRMDMLYLRRRSFFYDLKLVVRTAVHALMHRGSV